MHLNFVEEFTLKTINSIYIKFSHKTLASVKWWNERTKNKTNKNNRKTDSDDKEWKLMMKEWTGGMGLT